MPRNELVDLPSKHCKNIERKDRVQAVRIFFPSDWAQLDIATSQVFYAMYGTGQGGFNVERDLEPIVVAQQREHSTDACSQLMVPWQQEHITCGSGSNIEITIKRPHLDYTDAHAMSTTDNTCLLQAMLVATWCVGTLVGPTPIFDRAQCENSLSDDERLIVRALSTADSNERPEDDDVCFVVPGDICKLLSDAGKFASCGGPHEAFYQAVLINRFWRHQDGLPSSLIIWLRTYASNNEDGGNNGRGIEIIDYDIVLQIHLAKHLPPSSEADQAPFRASVSLYMALRIIFTEYCCTLTTSRNLPEDTTKGL